MTAYPNAIPPGMYKQMVVRIEYTLTNPTAGVRFVGCEPGDTVPTLSFPPYVNKFSDCYSDILTFILQMTHFQAQQVHGYLVWMTFGKDVPGKSTLQSQNE